MERLFRGKEDALPLERNETGGFAAACAECVARRGESSSGCVVACADLRSLSGDVLERITAPALSGDTPGFAPPPRLLEGQRGG